MIARIINRDIIIAFKYIIYQKVNSNYIYFVKLLFYLIYLRRSRLYKTELFSDFDFTKVDKKRTRFKIKIKSLELAEKIIF